MKKKLVMVMISTMLVASLMACGSKKETSGKASTKTEQSANNNDTKDAKKTEEKELSYDTIKDYPVTKASDFETGPAEGTDGVVIGNYRGKDKVVVIPSKIDGKDVVGIESMAFANHTDIEGVVIPQGVLFVNDSAFVNCTKLTYVVLPEGLKKLDHACFAGANVTDIVLPASLEDINNGGALLMLKGKVHLAPGFNADLAKIVNEYAPGAGYTVVQD